MVRVQFFSLIMVTCCTVQPTDARIAYSLKELSFRYRRRFPGSSHLLGQSKLNMYNATITLLTVSLTLLLLAQSYHNRGHVTYFKHTVVGYNVSERPRQLEEFKIISLQTAREQMQRIPDGQILDEWR
jgi:hypothetical protein